MPKPPLPSSRYSLPAAHVVFAVFLGLWLALGPLKFGTPVVLEDRVVPPQNAAEFLIQSWPVGWGYTLLAIVFFASIPLWRWPAGLPKWVVALPAIWWAWQVLSGLGTVDSALTVPTLQHFLSCVISFYVGLFAFSRLRVAFPAWGGLVAGFAIVLAVGWRQHFGGLEVTRQYFYELPNWQEYPREFIIKLASNRIFSTLFYPNALAGVILLWLPVVLVLLWGATRKWERKARLILAGLTAVAGLACLYWSESKAGWLIALAMSSILFLHLRLNAKAKLVTVAVLLAAGLTGFMVKYSGYFERGATSVGARFDYWRVAAQIVAEHPLLGSGPGTFMVGYKERKSPEEEMARLVHNDYLQQASDSGLPAFLVYAGLFWASLALLYRQRKLATPLQCAVWLGLVGITLQGLVEFGLYIPAIAWPQFLLLGWLWGTISKPSA